MKVCFLGHASVLVETDGISILSDPWWRGPCFGAQWWNKPDPTPELVPSKLDYIYISHGHDDHLHPGTLKTLPTEAKVLVSAELDIAPALRNLGFQVIEISPEEEFPLSERVSARIWPTHAGDSLCVISDGSETLVNINDALHSAPADVQDRHIAKLRGLGNDLTYVFCGYGTASHFPNCYFIPGKNREQTAAMRQEYFNRQWARIIHELEPSFGFPFAANVVFLESDLVDVNEATHNSQRPTDCFASLYDNKTKTSVVDIAPGFSICDGVIESDKRVTPLDIGSIISQDEEAYRRANSYSAPDEAELSVLLELIQANIETCSAYLKEYRGNYRFGILFRGSEQAIQLSKQGSEIAAALSSREACKSCHITFETRAVYLRRSLQIDYADEVLFVGSGGVFRIQSPELAKQNLHRELAIVLKKQRGEPKSRYADNPPWLYHLKRWIKRMLGKGGDDLYDLNAWTIYD